MMRASCFLILALVCGSATAQRQDRRVEGVVRDAVTRVALAGASVTLEWDGAIVGGAVADSTGRYSLTPPGHGPYRLVARHVSFTSAAVVISLAEFPLTQDFHLEPTAIGLEEVEITAGPFQPVSDVSVAVTKVSARTIQALAGGGEDVLQALRAFPGVQTSGDYSTQLYIRGGTPDQNLILIDDIEVFSPYQLSGMGSLLNPEMVREVELFAGTMPAAYGDRLSSALVVTTREGRADGGLHGRVNTTMMTVNTTLEGATGFWRGSWIASARKTYFGSFANTFARRIGIFNDIAFPDFADGHFKLALRPSRDHLVRATVLVSRDNLDWVIDEDALAAQGRGEQLYRGGKDIAHTAVGIQWRYVPNELISTRWYGNWYENRGSSALGGGLQAWMAGLKNFDSPFGPPDPVFSSDREAQFEQQEQYAVRRLSMGTRISIERAAHSIEAGAGMDQYFTDLKLDFKANEFARTLFDAIRMADPLFESMGEQADAVRTDVRAHLFVQDRIRLWSGALFVQPAMRAAYYSVAGRAYLTPRLSVSVPAGARTTLRAAAGRYVQSPGLEKTLDPDDNFNTARFESLAGLAAEEAWHVGVSLSHRIGARWRTRVQAYRKWYRALLTRKFEVASRAVAKYFPAGSPEPGRVSALTPSAWVIDFQERPVLLTELENGGRGWGHGAEVIIARERLQPSDRLHGWIAYAWAHASREADYGTGTYRRPFAYDRRHTVNLVVQWQLWPSLAAGVTWRYGSGFPYTPAIDMRALVALVEDPNQPGVTQEVVLADPATGYARLVPGFGGPENLYSGQLPAYHRLDVRLTFETRWNGLDLRVYAEAINAYNRKNTVTNKYFVGTDARDYSHLPLALRPPPKVTMFREPIYGFPFIPGLGLSCSF